MTSADIPHGRHAVGRAAALAAAAADTADPDLHAKIEAELNAALADVEAGTIDLDELVAALAELAGRALDEAARLRMDADGTAAGSGSRSEVRAALLEECVGALRPPEPAAEPNDRLASPVEPGQRELRSGEDRRLAERRAHADDSPPALVNRWLHGERRQGTDRRAGVPRRWSDAGPSRDEG